MVSFIEYPSSLIVIKGVNQNPIPNNETNVLVVHEDKNYAESLVSGSSIYSDVGYVGAIRSKSQASLRGKITLGSLNNVLLRVYFFTSEVDKTQPFIQTASVFSAGEQVLNPMTIKIASSVAFDYQFPLPACDGILITVQGVGTNTGSVLEKLHLALRTN